MITIRIAIKNINLSIKLINIKIINNNYEKITIKY